MKSLNKVQLIGHLGIDPEVKNLDKSKVARFTLATSESYRDKQGNKVEVTDWHNIVLWRGLADLAEKYMKKGSRIYFEGRSKSRSWEDDNGQKHYTTEFVADNIILLDKKETEDSNSPQE